MIKSFRKLFFGKDLDNTPILNSALKNQIVNLKKIWENEHHNDTGLERIFRLFLIVIQFVFPGIYIREFFSRKGLTFKNLSIELYVLLKLIYPILVFFLGVSNTIYAVTLSIYFLVETVTYISSLVFTSDLKYQSRSANRTILLLFINYLEISLQFSVLYAGFNMLSASAVTGVDYIYFSFVTSASIGFGDIYPITQAGKILVCCQSFLLVIFIVLFFNYFRGKKIDN